MLLAAGSLAPYGSVEVFPDVLAAAASLDRPGLSLVYRTREALERVSKALAGN